MHFFLLFFLEIINYHKFNCHDILPLVVLHVEFSLSDRIVRSLMSHEAIIHRKNHKTWCLKTLHCTVIIYDDTGSCVDLILPLIRYVYDKCF